MVVIEDVTEAETESVAKAKAAAKRRKNASKLDDLIAEEEVQSSQKSKEKGSSSQENSEDIAQDVSRELTFDERVDQAREAYQPTAMEKLMSIVKSLILRALVIYFVMWLIRSKTNPKDIGTSQSSPLTSNIFPNSTKLDMYIYLSEENKLIRDYDQAQLVWKQAGLIYGDWHGGPNNDGTFIHDSDIRISKRAQNNGTIYLHTYFVQSGFSPDPKSDYHSRSRTLYSSFMINRYKKRKYAQTHNLLTGQTAASKEEQEKAKIMSSEIISHWHSNITVNLVTDWTGWSMGAVPVPLNEYIEFIPAEMKYKPGIYHNNYWNLVRDYYPINETTPVLPLRITYQPLSLLKLQLFAAQGMKNSWTANKFSPEDDDEQQDTLKELLMDNNAYLLGLTLVVSILHSIFEFLAFKNDIQFWKNTKSLEGLSVRSVFFNVFQSLVVLLYILDNETSFLVQVSVFVGLLIEIWKINKVMDVKIDRENRVMGVFPKIRFSDKGSYVESSTKVYDEMAFRYLSWLVFPLLIGYAVYSLLYLEHKGLYSWVLSMMYGFLLTFGFITMTPQLFINYKLKSVAHLPWRMLSYKFLNTFIDDIFAFVIKTPTMYRIGCLRDDVIFLVYLYQRYIYRTDYTRVNEFGYSMEKVPEEIAPGDHATTEETHLESLDSPPEDKKVK